MGLTPKAHARLYLVAFAITEAHEDGPEMRSLVALMADMLQAVTGNMEAAVAFSFDAGRLVGLRTGEALSAAPKPPEKPSPVEDRPPDAVGPARAEREWYPPDPAASA